MVYEKTMPAIVAGDLDIPMPELGLLTHWLLQAFYDLSAERRAGFNAPERLTSATIHDYAIIMGIEDVKFFYKAMKAADAVWFKHKVK